MTPLDSILQDQSQLKGDLSEVQTTLAQEKALNAKRHKDLLSTLTTTLPRSFSLTMFSPYSYLPVFTLFVPTVCTVFCAV